jgi:hypothetical protein
LKFIALPMAFGAIGTGLAACSPVHQPAPISSNAPGSSKSAASLQVHIPDALKAPSGNTLAGSFEDISVTSQDFTVDAPTVFE